MNDEVGWNVQLLQKCNKKKNVMDKSVMNKNYFIEYLLWVLEQYMQWVSLTIFSETFDLTTVVCFFDCWLYSINEALLMQKIIDNIGIILFQQREFS